MSKIIYSASDCHKGHISLKRYNALYLLSIIVDEKAEHETKDVVMAICEKLNIQYSDNYSIVDSGVFQYILNNDGLREISESYWKVYLEGVVEIIYDAQEITYKTSDGKEYSYRFFEISNLYINENKIEEDDWDHQRINKFIEDVEVLFSIKPKEITEYYDVFEIAWERFEKGDKWRTRDQMVYAAELIECKETEKFTKEHTKGIIKGCIFITKKWFEYLWECRDKGTPDDYIMSLKTFISKNQKGWAENKENHVVVNKIYTTEHEEIVKCFVSEIEILYKSSWTTT